MSHVDEATLHALLDGELRARRPEEADRVERHIQSCDTCRARLEEATATRDDAAGILDALDTGAPPGPDFEEVRVRAGQRPASPPSGPPAEDQDGPRRGYRWMKRVGWAAVLVVALGTGYMARDLVLGPGDTAEDPAADFMVPDRASRSRAAEPPPDVQRPATPVESEAGADAGAGEAADAGAAPGEMEPPEPTTRRLAEDAPPDPTDTAALLAQEAAVAATAAGVERWVEASIEEAEARVGPLYLLPGAEIIDVAVTADTAVPAVRTVQRVAAREVHVIQQPAQGPPEADADPEAALEMPRPDLEGGRGQEPVPLSQLMESTIEHVERQAEAEGRAAPSVHNVRVTVEGATLTLTGSMSAQGLRLLARSARRRTP